MSAVTPWNATRFVLKHTVSTLTVVVGTGLIAAMSWIVLFLWTLMTNGGAEPPFSFPRMVMWGLGLGLGAAAVVLMPATIVSEAVSSAAGRRIWSKLPIVSLVLVLMTFGAAGVYGASGAPLAVSLSLAIPGAGLLLLLLLIYWSALQSTDWLLTTFARTAARISPARFGHLLKQQEPHRSYNVRGGARFRVKEHFTFYSGQSPVLVISGDVLDGHVHAGMRARASVSSQPLSARIQSVERTPEGNDSQLGLLLAVSERDMGAWKSAAHEGAVLDCWI